MDTKHPAVTYQPPKKIYGMWTIRYDGKMKGSISFRTKDDADAYFQAIVTSGKCLVCDGFLTPRHYMSLTRDNIIATKLCFSCLYEKHMLTGEQKIP